MTVLFCKKQNLSRLHPQEVMTKYKHQQQILGVNTNSNTVQTKLSILSMNTHHRSDMGSIPFSQFQSIQFQFHMKFINFNSIKKIQFQLNFLPSLFYLLPFTRIGTPITYSEYLLGIPTMSSLISK